MRIYKKQELDILKGKCAKYKSLHFSFSDQYLQTLKDLLHEKNAFQMFAKDANNNFAGYIAAAEKKLKARFLWIVELFVEPKYQGQGIGSGLLRHATQQAKEKKLDGFITQTEFENIPAQNLYKKRGFAEIDNPEWKDGITYELRFTSEKKNRGISNVTKKI